jgi:hypothetical protein
LLTFLTPSIDYIQELISNGVPQQDAKEFLEAYLILKRGDPEELKPYITKRKPGEINTVPICNAVNLLKICEMYGFELDDFPEFLKKSAEGKLSIKDKKGRPR